MILKSYDPIQQKTFNVLFKNGQLKHNPDGVIFNYSKIFLSDAEKSLSVRGCPFSQPPRKLSYADYLNNFELFHRSIWNLGNFDFVKTKIKDADLSSFCFYNGKCSSKFVLRGIKSS